MYFEIGIDRFDFKVNTSKNKKHLFKWSVQRLWFLFDFLHWIVCTQVHVDILFFRSSHTCGTVRKYTLI